MIFSIKLTSIFCKEELLSWNYIVHQNDNKRRFEVGGSDFHSESLPVTGFDTGSVALLDSIATLFRIAVCYKNYKVNLTIKYLCVKFRYCDWYIRCDFLSYLL